MNEYSCKRNKDMALAINIENLLNKQKIESNSPTELSLRKVGIRQAYTIVYVLSPMILMILAVDI